VPILLVRGHRSDVVTDAVADEFLRLVPQAQYANIAEARHMFVGDRNDVFLDAVEPFLTTLS
jgi:pimeloyl-ACP methyl ester carboxylesterase